eukprot:267026-Rhodomonas_salina.1
MSKAVTRTSRTWMRSPPPLALPQAHPRLSRHCPGPNPPRPPFTSSPSSLVVTSRLIWSRPLCSQPPLIPHPLVSQPGPTPVHLVEKHGRLRGKRNSCQEKGCCAFLTGRCGSRGQLVGMSGMLYGLHARKYALAPTSLSSGLLSPKVWRVFFPVGLPKPKGSACSRAQLGSARHKASDSVESRVQGPGSRVQGPGSRVDGVFPESSVEC